MSGAGPNRELIRFSSTPTRKRATFAHLSSDQLGPAASGANRRGSQSFSHSGLLTTGRRPELTDLSRRNIQQVLSCSEGIFDGSAVALIHPSSVRRLTVCHYLITVEFDDGQLATTQYSSPSDVKTKLAEVVNDLTDEDGIEHFRSVTVTQAA